MNAPLWLVHCDLHVDTQGDVVPCPGHYVRMHQPVHQIAQEVLE